MVTNVSSRFSLWYTADILESTVKTHPFVPSIVTVCDISDRPGRVQSFGMFYQGPSTKKTTKKSKGY